MESSTRRPAGNNARTTAPSDPPRGTSRGTSRDAAAPERKPSTGRRFTQDEIDTAAADLPRGFAILGLISDDNTLICPVCGTAKRKKVEIKTSSTTGRPYWTCHKCPETWGSSAIELLTRHGGRTFPEAVTELLGAGATRPAPKIVIAEAFAATVDVEVYDAIVAEGDVAAAQAYYGRWHIAADVVAASGATVIPDPDATAARLTERFGLQRLIDCGVVTSDRHGKPVFLFNRDYPVVEPHLAPSGHVVGMQYRPSVERAKAVQAHKAWKRTWSGHVDADGNPLEPDEAWRRAYEKDQTVGRKAPYVTPFLSLKGGTPDHLVGCGLERLVRITRPSTVYVVEGFKDLLAARTMGVEAYAIPGTGVMPPPRSVEILALHQVVVMLDGDQAGAIARGQLVDYLVDRSVNARPVDKIRDGLDVADVLVERHAHGGCTCPTCSAWRDTHPWNPETCPCRTCRNAAKPR